MIPTKLGMVVALVLIIFLIMFMLWRRDRDAHSMINLEDLLIGEDGKLSKAAAIMMGAFAFTTWMMGYLTLMGKMTEGYAAIYVGAWITPTVVKLITGPRPASPPGDGT